VCADCCVRNGSKNWVFLIQPARQRQASFFHFTRVEISATVSIYVTFADTPEIKAPHLSILFCKEIFSNPNWNALLNKYLPRYVVSTTIELRVSSIIG
jgi:hypothetical protein